MKITEKTIKFTIQGPLKVMRSLWETSRVHPGPSRNGFSAVMTLLEVEGVDAEEGPLVSIVFLRRRENGQPLCHHSVHSLDPE